MPPTGPLRRLLQRSKAVGLLRVGGAKPTEVGLSHGGCGPTVGWLDAGRRAQVAAGVTVVFKSREGRADPGG